MSDEEIAREAAEALITVEPYEPEDGEYWVAVGRSSKSTGDLNIYRNKRDAEYDADLLRNNSVAHFLAAIAKARRQLPVESPVTEERLDDIQKATRVGSPWGVSTVTRDLLAHIDHLERTVSFFLHEPEGEAARALLDRAKERGPENDRRRTQRVARPPEPLARVAIHPTPYRPVGLEPAGQREFPRPATVADVRRGARLAAPGPEGLVPRLL